MKKHGSTERTDHTSRKKLNEMEVSSLPDADFKTVFFKKLFYSCSITVKNTGSKDAQGTE